MKNEFNQVPTKIINSKNNNIYCFNTDTLDSNIDVSVVNSFGEEWSKFNDFKDEEIDKLGKMYFDILDEKMVNKNTYAIDIGCGTGRWTKYLLNRIGFIEAIDPSKAIITADSLIGKNDKIRLSMASTDNIPFADETFDFGMSIGVLHHIPNTQKAMIDCVKKIKIGGYFYTYLYYNLENKGSIFKFILVLVTLLRKLISKLPTTIKKIACDVIALLVYMPIILLGRLFNAFGFPKIAKNLPLNMYQNQTFFVIRNDSLDRFGTSLEQRFSKKEIVTMMNNCGLEDIIISKNLPYWHAVGKRIK